MDVVMTIGDRVKQHRTARGWTQDDLAANSGISLTSVQRAERGRPVSADTINCLAAAFNLDTIDLVDPDPRDGQPYLPLRLLSGGRELNTILAFAERLDFDFAELEDLDQAALIEGFQDYCKPGGKARIPDGAVARVQQELAGKALLQKMHAAGLRVTGSTFEINVAEIQDDCDGSMPMLIGQWEEGCAVIRISTDRTMLDRAYVMDSLCRYETPIGSAVIFPKQEDDLAPLMFESFSFGAEDPANG